MTDNIHHIGQLIIKHLRGELSPAEEIELKETLETSESARKVFNEVTDADKVKKELALRRRFNREASYQRVQERINSSRRSKTIHFKRYFAAAAFLIIIAVSIVYINREPSQTSTASASVTGSPAIKPGGPKATLALSDGTTLQLNEQQQGRLTQQGPAEVIKQSENTLQYFSTGNTGTTQYNTLTTPNGGTYELILPDGSKAVLNAGSSIRYPVSFPDNMRQVTITGEVYFEIASLLRGQEKVPFRVAVATSNNKTMRAWVEVLGTKFNVQAYADRPAIKTTLIEGKVLIGVPGTGKQTELSPGQEVYIDADGIISNPSSNTTDATGWIKGTYRFNNAGIRTVMTELEKWYDIEVTFNGTIPDIKKIVSISRSLPFEEVQALLREIYKVSITTEGKKVTISTESSGAH